MKPTLIFCENNQRLLFTESDKECPGCGMNSPDRHVVFPDVKIVEAKKEGKNGDKDN